MPNCKFFFSYARNDAKNDGDQCLERFFRDLGQAVLRKTGVKELDQVCFRDTSNMDIGGRWDDEIVTGLQTSSVLVCLYSRSYFESEYCGKEVQVFLSRIKEYQKLNKDVPRVILPVLWETPTFPIHPSLQDIQYTHETISKKYEEKGLRTLRSVSSFRNDYKQFVELLALKIQEKSESINLPPVDIRDIQSVNSAFHLTPTGTHTNRKDMPNPHQIRFIYAVGTKNELQKEKETVENYDEEDAEFWKPFYPENQVEIGIITQEIAHKRSYMHRYVAFSDNLIEVIKKAKEYNCIVILIVDPWSLKIKKYQTPIKKFDELRFSNSAAVIIWNLNDKETIQNLETLKANTYDSFFECKTENVLMIKDEINNLEELYRNLYNAIDEAQANILQRGKIYRTILNNQVTSLPILNANGD